MDDYTPEKQFMTEQSQYMYLEDSSITSTADEDVKVIIGGITFTTKASTLKNIPGSTLASLSKSSAAFSSAHQAYCFDRDPDAFKYILNAHREGELHVPRDVCAMSFRKEMKFWRVPHRMLAPCCWKQFYSIEDDMNTIDTLLRSGSGAKMKSASQIGVMPDKVKGDDAAEPLPKLWLFLEEPASSTAARIWCFVYIMVVVTSAITFIIWLEPSVRVKSYLTLPNAPPHSHGGMGPGGAPHAPPGQPRHKREAMHNEKLQLLGSSDPHPALLITDAFCSFFFILETLVHFWACPHKTVYLKDPYNVTRIFLTFTMTTSFVLELNKHVVTTAAIGKLCIAIKGLNVLRLLLIFRLRKLYNGLHIMLLSLERSIKEFVLLMFAFMITVIIYGGMIFCMEIDTDMFSDTLSAMWWAVITMTTVGYGDFYPTHALGYFIGLICAINGLVVLALPVAAIASNFSTLFARNAEIENHMEAVRQEENEGAEGNKR